MSTILCRVQRPLWLAGQSHPAGATLRVSATDAALLLESGRAELVDKADLAAVKTAVDGATAAALRRPAASFDRDEAGPWQRRV